MKIESHLRDLKESLEAIHDGIARGLENRQRTIGFNCSAAATDLLEIYLHQKELIDPGANIKHNWFSSVKTAAKRLPDFPSKPEILQLLNAIERKRNILCYGNPQSVDTIKEAINVFNELKTKLEHLGVKIK